MPVETVRIEGLADLNRAFGKFEGDLKKGLRRELLAAAEPVRAGAEVLARDEIRNIGDQWSRMKLTGSAATAVVMRPKSRRKGGSPRPNLKALLLRPMEESLVRYADPVRDRLGLMIDRIARGAGF